MRVIRIGERYSISTDEVETYDLLPVKTYVVLYNEKDGFYLTVERPFLRFSCDELFSIV